MKLHLLLLIFLLQSFYLSAQTDTCSGRVTDEKDEGIPGASVFLLRAQDTTSFKSCGGHSHTATITDVDGNFSIAAAPGHHFIGIQALGFPSYVGPCGTSNHRLHTPDEFLIDTQVVKPYKPAIYLYPTRNKTAVSIKHAFKGTIGTTYPAYGNGWEVIADTNGNLYNTQDKRQYEYLFWDGKVRFPDEHFKFKTGFVVPKEESQAFLWEQLALIGLNNKEINDFVVYWLPQLEQNEQNFIYFRINDDIDHSSVLTVTPQPDSWIRLFMEFKSVPASFSIAPQQLQSYPRKGFTLVEWGGAKLEEKPASIQ